MNTSLGSRCHICGAIIDYDNPDGICFSCREAYNKAKWKWCSRIDENRFLLWSIEVNHILPLFISTFKDIKFRSKFRKSFYPSVCQQYNYKGRISRKQLDICLDWLIAKIDDKDLDNLFSDIYIERKRVVEDYMRDFFEHASDNDIVEFRAFINSMR